MHRLVLSAALGAALGAGLAACAATDAAAPPPPATVEAVDLGRYAGTWYEIARFPNRFQDGAGRRCEAVTATYGPAPDGTVRVVNRCRDAAAGGRERVAEGWARPTDASNARLRVTFAWPFFGDYWVIGLDPEYRWAVVGTPGRDFLWVLARRPSLPAGAYSEALEVARSRGFETRRLVPTPQDAGEPGRTAHAGRAEAPSWSPDIN